MIKKIDWQAKEILLSKIKKFSGSLREFSISDLKKIEDSIGENGLIEPIMLNKDLTLIDGELRFEALKSLGAKKCICMVPSRLLTDEEHMELYLRKNRNIAGIDDYSILRKHFTTEELERGGFDPMEIKDIQIDPKDIKVEEKPEVFLYKMKFETKEQKKEAEELLSRLRSQYTVEESFEENLLSFMKKILNI